MEYDPVRATSGAPVTRIGRYEILGEFGQGTKGIVYKARDPQLERLVAIRTLRADLGLPAEQYADAKTRFYRPTGRRTAGLREGGT